MGDTVLRYLPSKRFVVVALPLVVGFSVSFGLIAWSAVKTVESEQGESQLLASAGKALDTFAAEDTDFDGLENWEESLWGTDPHNSDTDGDGTMDGDEVVRNRNPLVPWPDDVLNPHAPTNKEGVIYELYSATNTSQFAQNFFTSYLYLKQQGTVDAVSRNQLFGELVANVPIGQLFASYSQEDIIVTTDTTRETIETYRDSFVEVLNQVLRIRVPELIMAKEALEQGDQEVFHELRQASDVYNEITTIMQSVPVPETAVGDHLAILNSMEQLRFIAGALGNAEQEPLQAIIAVKLLSSRASQNQASTNLRQLFEQYDLGFENIVRL